MAKGLPKWAIKEARARGARNVFAYAWSLVKRKKGTKRRSTRSRKSNPKRRVKKTVRRRRNPGRRGGFSTRTIFKFLRIGALIAPGVNEYVKFQKAVGPGKAAVIAIQSYAGMDANGKFNMGILTQQWTPFLMTTLVTYGIGKLAGIIRRI